MKSRFEPAPEMIRLLAEADQAWESVNEMTDLLDELEDKDIDPTKEQIKELIDRVERGRPIVERLTVASNAYWTALVKDLRELWERAG